MAQPLPPRAFDPALDAPCPPRAAPSRTPVTLVGGLQWPPPRRVLWLAPIVVLGELAVLYGLDRAIAAHMGVS
jgi:hypothetical protein